MSNGEKRHNIAPEGRGRWHTDAAIRAAAAEGVRVWLDVGRRISRHQRPGRHRLTQPPGQPNTKESQRGHRKRRYPLFFVADFSPRLTVWATSNGSQGTPAAAEIVRTSGRLSRLRGMPSEIRRKHRNATGSPRSLAKCRGSGNTDPQRKTAPAAVKMAKRRKRPAPGHTRARAFIPRAVVKSRILSCKTPPRGEPEKDGSRGRASACEGVGAPDQPPAAETRGEPGRGEGRGVTAAGMFRR